MLEFRVFLRDRLIQKTLLSKGQITLGRAGSNDVVLPDPHVSRLHGVIVQERDGYRVEDRSTNGILLNGKRIVKEALLPPECRITIYPFEIHCLQRKDEQTLPIQQEPASFAAPDPVSSPSPQETPPASDRTLTYHFGLLIGESPGMQQVYRRIQEVAPTPATVLIQGEHGTGKELVARAIHQASPRRRRPFIAVNCAAIPYELIESELFGYERGAFTGAHTTRKGKVEEAHGGTLFLDELGELSASAQAKLLRFLQEKTVTRLGSAREIPVDVRVVAATNKDLSQEVRSGTFRADLYYRIKVVQIRIPALRERPEDIPLLVQHILQRIRRELDLATTPVLSPEALRKLQEARWPGNVRQLENLLYGAAIRARSTGVIDMECLLSDSATWMGSVEEVEEPPLETLTRQHLLQVLREHNWDTARAAAVLKVSRGTVYYKLKKYGIHLREIARRGDLR